MRKFELIVRKLELIVRFEKFVEGGMGQEQKVYVIFRFSKNQGGEFVEGEWGRSRMSM